MLTQKILGSEYKKIKYHGLVKFLIFECNNCRKSFSKMESYSKKQLKIHKNACCFCSADCRNDYFNQKTKETVKKAHTPVVAVSKGNGKSVMGWLNKIFG